jgi:regulator of nucleoside diphosphate kinase
MISNPNIVVSALDAERLGRLLERLPNDAFPGKADLENELERAEVVRPEDVPPTVVTMNSTVRFKVSNSDKEFCLTLVYPDDVDSTGQTISILAPVGSAILGLSEGDEIEWPRPGGGTMSVHVVGLSYQPERAGHHYR